MFTCFFKHFCKLISIRRNSGSTTHYLKVDLYLTKTSTIRLKKVMSPISVFMFIMSSNARAREGWIMFLSVAWLWAEFRSDP